jgi:hypothetical protein
VFLRKCPIFYEDERLVRYVAYMEDMIYLYKVLTRKSEGKKPLGRCRHRQENNIRLDLG